MASNEGQPEVYVFDASRHTGVEVIRLLKDGKHPICPVCKSLLIVAFSAEDARAQNVLPGIRCPKDERHFCAIAYLKSDKELWKRIEEQMKKK
jgi:hypothetical protein